MTAMDEYTDNAMEADDIFPCKGCGEILEEGKAFELAGHRWHLNCFRCNTCGTLLDSDANLLLLGDGSLICNNCTYSCSACGNKIEDLAILTGDQAFCATCFRCRNCKRKIENLRYARTSQGIFCMSCHESLMARRRKKHKAAAQAKAAREKEASPMITEKSLPALPPSAAGPGSLPGPAPGPSSDAPSELSPRPRAAYNRNEMSLRSAGSRPDRPDRLDRSPDPSISDASTAKDLSAAVHASVAAASNTRALSPPSYRNNRNSTILMGGSVDLGVGDGESFFIPVALDPSPVLTGPSQPRDNTRDYFSPSLTESSKRSERSNDASSSHTSTPHIAYQEKSRDSDYDSRSVTPRDTLDRRPSKSSKSVRSERSTAEDQPQQQQQRTPNGRVEEFRLQEAPKSKKAANAQRNNSLPFSDDGNGNGAPKAAATSANASRRDNAADRPDFSPSTSTSTSVSSTGVRLSQDPRRAHDEEASERQSIDSTSLSGSGSAASTTASVSTLSNRTPTAGIHRKEVAPRSANSQEKQQQPPQPPPQGRFAMNRPTKLVTSDDGILSSPPPAIPQHGPPPPLAQRPGLQEHKLTDTYMQPRAPPQPPAASPSPAAVAAAQTPSRDAVAIGSDGNPASPPTGPSPKLPRWSSGGDFSLDEDMARILGTDEGSSSILRRVSNAVRHGRNSSAESSNLAHHSLNGGIGGGSHPAPPRGGPGHNRSISETTRGAASPRWPKTPIVEDSSDLHSSRDISSPISLASGTPKEDPAFLKRQLRNSEQRVAELERQFGAEKDLKSLNKKLLEKRRTVSVLDTQTEIMIRQLEVLAGYVERAKVTNQPIDAKELEDSAIKDFVQRLNDLQKSMSTSIEQLHAERDLLLEEKNQAMADRDRALLEFEQLSSKNAQLADMNNDLTHQIQERFKSQIGNMEQLKSPSIGGGIGGLGSGGGNGGSAGGLGIYHSHKGPSISSMNLETASIQTSGGGTLVGTDADESIVESGPTVVNIRKGQVRKFNWKKGSKTVAQNLSKGVNRAVGAFQNERERPPYQGLTGDNIGLPYNMTVASANSPIPFGGGGNGSGMGVGGGGGGGGGSSDGGGFGGSSSNAAGLNSNGHGNGGNGGFGGNGTGSEMGGLQPMNRAQAEHAAMMNGGAGGGFGFFKKSSGLPKSNTAASLMSSVAAAAAASASGPVPAEPPSTLFGSELVERADFERRQIPSVVTRCIEEVELRGMDVEGIYRKTGGNSQVKAIQEGFEKHEDYDISDPDLDITAVTSVLKQYFRKLPNPLLTFEVYDRILESASVTDNEERCNHLRKTFNMLPQKHRDCLEFLMFHLSRVANRERENLMSPKNLAVVFAPTIMRDHSLEREMTDMHSKNLAVQFVIENSHIIFSEA